MIYHLAWRSEWEHGSKESPYRHASLETEGFIHCTREPEKLLEVADLFFATAPTEDLLVVSLDEARIGSEVKDEDPGVGHLFPHVYGPIDRAAVLRVDAMRRADDRWALPASLT